jgi:TolB-like protein/Tfp pilus assembly protein PilF
MTRHAGELVTREQIIQELWGDETFVDYEHGINFCIRQIRAALDDDAESPRYIETVPRRGYRFVAVLDGQTGAVQSLLPAVGGPDAAASTKHWSHWRAGLVIGLLSASAILLTLGWRHWNGAATAGRRMLVVLPFENLSGVPDDAYLADGFTEDTTTLLARLDARRLGVIARTSANRYRHAERTIEQIGRDLGVDFVLEGSVRREADRIRVTAQLIQVRDQTHLWADTYEYGLGETLSVQADLSRRIEQALNVRLLTARPDATRVDPVAYDHYLRGRFFLDQRTDEGLKAGFESLERAVHRDPTFAPAYIALAEYYFIAGDWLMQRSEAWPKALAATEKAIALSGLSSDTHFARGRLYLEQWRWQAGAAEIGKAVALNPNSADAHIWNGQWLLLTGNVDEAIAEAQEARRLDPLSAKINTRLAVFLWWAGRHDEALEECRRTLELEPRAFPAHLTMAMALTAKRMYAEAIADAEHGRQLANDNAEILGSVAYVHAVSGDAKAARQLLERLDREPFRFGGGRSLAKAWAWIGLGDRARTLESLEAAYREHDELIAMIKAPVFASLRSDPRFQDLLRRIGLPLS